MELSQRRQPRARGWLSTAPTGGDAGRSIAMRIGSSGT
jgi:hypothetical protein